jgi:hypothetical protein
MSTCTHPSQAGTMRNWQHDAGKTWSDRLADWVASQPGDRAFLEANITTLRYWLTEHGHRVVVNAGAFALERLLLGDHYKNRYELSRIGGSAAPPSPRRIKVDRLLGFQPDGAEWYFGAIAVGGTGVRFYGEYCLVLAPEVKDWPVQFLDRNSYDLLDPPLVDAPDAISVVKALKTTWQDLPETIAIKVLSSVTPAERLVTVGLVAEMTLRDEDFIEAHLHRPTRPDGTRSFGLASVEEVRQAPEEVAQHQHLQEQQANGRIPSAAELEWCSRRARVERLLDSFCLPSRVVTSNGRGARWR